MAQGADTLNSPHAGSAQRTDYRTKIAVTGLRGMPDVMGGVETHCEELIPRLAALAPDMSFTVYGRSGYVPAYQRLGDNIAVRATPCPKSAALEAIISSTLAVLQSRVDGHRCIHIHAIGPALVTPLARLLGMRVVVTHHGRDYDRAKWGRLAKAMLRLGERCALMMAHRVIVVAPSLGDDLSRDFAQARERIRFIPNGAPTLPTARDDACSDLGVTPGDFILAVARLVPEKGLHDLIEAQERSGDTRRLLIVGAADHDSSYARDLLARQSDRVRCAGRQDRATLHSLYRKASLFVLPSYHEGLPIAALEAGSVGCPMLLSDIQPNLDIGLPGHHYFPTGDVDSLAEHLKHPATEFSTDKQSFLQRFDWDRIAHQTMAVYDEITTVPRHQ